MRRQSRGVAVIRPQSTSMVAKEGAGDLEREW